MKINVICAMNKTNAIGLGGELLYRIPRDLKRFKALTSNNIVLMGKTTHLEIGCALPNRINAVLSRTEGFNPEGVFVYNSFEDALNQLETIKNDTSELFIIGGSQLYAKALPIADKVYLTYIEDDAEGDVHFPHEYLIKNFRPTHIESHIENGYMFSFIDYVRKEEV